MARFNSNLPLVLIYQDSIKYYRSKKIDNKERRMKLDIVSAKISNKNNFKYNKSTKQWESNGKSSTIKIEVKSHPKSYKSFDSIKTHIYPITFEFQNINLGLLTPFKWREGGLKKPIFKIQGIKNKKLARKKIANANISNHTQLQFFFEMEFVAKKNLLLWGVCRANRPPRKTNPKGKIYFGKHALFALRKIIIPLLKSGKLLQGKVPNK